MPLTVFEDARCWLIAVAGRDGPFTIRRRTRALSRRREDYDYVTRYRNTRSAAVGHARLDDRASGRRGRRVISGLSAR